MLMYAEFVTYSGSVIAKHDRICPRSSGFSQRSFCEADANRHRVSMLPVSGEAQFIHCTNPLSVMSTRAGKHNKRDTGWCAWETGEE